MKLLFENWRKYIKEDVIDLASRRKSNEKEFVFSENELNSLNRTIAKIVNSAKHVLGAEGDTPQLSPEALEQVETVVAEDADNALQQGLDYIDGLDYNDQQKNALKQNLEAEFNDMRQKSSDGERYHGFAWGDNIEIETQKDGKMVKETINVPMTFALDKANMTVQSHELGHHTLFKSFMKNNPDAVGLVDDLEAYVKKNYKEAYERFNKVREAYRGEDLTREQMAEEQLAHLSDFMRQNNLQGDRTLHNKLFGRFQKVNDGKNQIETGKDVFDMLTSYNQSFETGELQGLAKSVLKGEAVVKRKAQQARDVRAKEQIADIDASLKAETQKPKGKFSKFIQGETAAERSKRQTQRNVDVAEVYKQDAEGKDNEGWKDFLDSPKGQRVMGELVNKYYPDMIATAIRQKAESPMDAASEALIPLMQHIQAFDPSKNKDLAGYIGGYLGLKVGTGIKRVAKKAPTVSMEKEGVRQVAEKQAVKEETKEEKPVRKGIKLAERLGDAAKKISEKVKKMKPVLEGKTYKTLKDLAPDDTQRMFGIVPKPGNLTRQDVKNAQAFINKNADVLLAMLPEGTTVSGKATGVQKVLLDAFYTKGRRVKAAKTGSKAGLATQTKRPDIKISEFKELFGITPAGQPNIIDRNTSARIKALVEQTGRLITNQAVREVTPDAPKDIAEGKSKVMFAKKIPTKAEQRKIDKLKELYNADPGAQMLAEQKSFDEIQRDYGVEPINLNTQEGKDELKARIFEGTDSVAPFMTFIPESVLTPGTLSNGGKNKSIKKLNKKGILTTVPLTSAQKKRLINSPNIGKVSSTEVQREYTLIDGSKILNTDPDFTSKEVQLKIAPVGRFLFANKLQIDNAIAEAKAKGYKFAPENSKIAMAVKRQGYTAKLLKEMKEPGFFEKQSQKRKGLKELMFAFNEAVQFNMNEYLPVVAGILSATSGSQGHLGRTGSIVEFYNTLDLRNVEEHTEPASDLMKFLVNRMAQGNLDEYIDPAIDSFFQGALPEVYDGMLKGVGKDGKKFDYVKNVPVEYIADVLLGLKPVWIRYFNPNVNSQARIDQNGKVHIGINPNVIILSNGKSIAENYGLKLDSKNINPETIALQQDLLFKIFNGDITVKEAQSNLKAALPIAIQKSKSATPANESMINGSGVMKSKDLSNSETIRQANILDKALDIARDPNAPVKKIRVFDFDDTLARTKSNVLYTMPDGKTGKLNAEEFAKKGTEMLEQGAEFDFSEFNKVMDGKKGPLFEVAEMIADKRGTQDMFVLTARAADAAPAIKEFLDSVGLNIPIQNITGLGDSSPLAKSGWIVEKAADGYNDFYFADDALKNVKAVKKVLDVIDVKSKVQQAKIKFSKDIDQTVNDMLQHKFGIKSEAEYSDVKARLVGRKKGKFKLFIPPSAEDFVGLLYSMLGKGEVGNMQMDFFKEHLIEPYGRAMENLSRDQNRIVNDFKALKNELVKKGLIPKNLNKKAIDKFTVQDVARILAWNKQGMDIPGISKNDLNKILKYAKDNPAIDVFAQNLIDINKGDGYAAPNENWLAGTISTDLLDGLRTSKRSNYLKQWKENVDIIFSPKNLNKMEAALGSNWREAMQDILRRMESGQNRSSTAGRLENRLLDYINNSVGTVMFFNMRSALLQNISAINFIDFGSNNIFKAAAAFANQKQYWTDFMTLMNSEFLVERRNGLKINVSESEIADAAATSKNKAKAAIAYILKKGYLPTQFADSFAIASGGSTFYRNKIKDLMKKNPKMTLKEAEKQAFQEFREIAEESQQSSRPDRISQQQASTLGRLILAFQNTPMQMNRLGKKSFLDLVNRRKKPGMTQFQSDMSNISRIGYYMAVQSIIFSSLQQALFALAFDDEEPEDEKERYYNVANGVINTILNGTGIVGVSVSTLISVARKVYKESAKEGTFPGPAYEDAANEMLNFSPPIDIKLSKLRQAGLTWKYEGYKHDKANWGIDDPAWKSAAYTISGLTNIPLDRLLNKAENVRSAVQDDWEAWQRVSLLLGWSKYQIQSKEDRAEEREAAKDEKAAFRKRIKDSKKRKYFYKQPLTVEEEEKLKEEKRRKKYKDLNKAEQVSKLDSLGLSKAEIRALKYEKDRVNKLLELMEE